MQPTAAPEDVALITAAGAEDIRAAIVSGNDSNVGGNFQNPSSSGQNVAGDNTGPSPSQVISAPQDVGAGDSGGAGSQSANTADFNVTGGANGIPGGGETSWPEGVIPQASATGPTSDATGKNGLAAPTPMPVSGRSLIREYLRLSNPGTRANPPSRDRAQALPPSECDPIIVPGDGPTPAERPSSPPRHEAGAGDTTRVPSWSDLMEAGAQPDWQTLGRDLRRFLSRFEGGEDTPDAQAWGWQAWVAILAALIVTRAVSKRVGQVDRRQVPADGETSDRSPAPPGPWPLGLS